MTEITISKFIEQSKLDTSDKMRGMLYLLKDNHIKIPYDVLVFKKLYYHLHGDGRTFLFFESKRGHIAIAYTKALVPLYCFIEDNVSTPYYNKGLIPDIDVYIKNIDIDFLERIFKRRLTSA